VCVGDTDLTVYVEPTEEELLFREYENLGFQRDYIIVINLVKLELKEKTKPIGNEYALKSKKRGVVNGRSKKRNMNRKHLFDDDSDPISIEQYINRLF